MGRIQTQATCPRGDVTEAELLSFLRNSIQSTWALELLLLLKQHPAKTFAPSELVRELRASSALVSLSASQLQKAGLIACDESGGCRFAPVSALVAEACDALAKLYSEKPFMVIKAIVDTPNERLRSFADAFRIKKKDE